MKTCLKCGDRFCDHAQLEGGVCKKCWTIIFGTDKVRIAKEYLEQCIKEVIGEGR